MPRTRSVAWSQLKLGIVGIVAIALVVTIVVAVGGQSGFWWQRYPLKLRFQDAHGLKTGALVRLSGKDVGAVTAIEFADAQIDLSIEVLKDVRSLVTSDSEATVGSISLLGESSVDIKAAKTGTIVPDWGYVRTVEPQEIAALTGQANARLDELGGILDDIRHGRGTLGKFITDDAVYRDLRSLLASAETVTKTINSGRGTLGQLMQDPAAYAALKTSLQNLEATTRRLNEGQGALARLLNDEAMGKSIGNTFSNLEQTTGRMGKADNTLGKLLTEKELYDRLNSMASQLDQVTAGLKEGRGTMGLLLRDQQLYENMNRTVTEIRDLVADIRKDPKKYLRVNVSIF